MDRLIGAMAETGAEVEKALDRYLPRLKAEPKTLHEAMRYSLFAGGKRLRPCLTVFSARLFGVPDAEALPAACAVEMIHTYSLIHDDLPAMDDDDYRRGKLSSHKAFGEAMAILAGDALLTLAFETIAAHSPPEAVPELVRILARASGHAGMVGGQVLDIESEDDSRTDAAPSARNKKKSAATTTVLPQDENPLARVKAIHSRKTGALIAATLEMGAVLGRAGEEERKALSDYGRKIGLAFQIKDDILDIEAPKDKLGKSIGKDAAAGKLTYPAVMGLDPAKALLRETAMDAKRLLGDFGEKALMLRLMVDFIVEREH